MKKIYNGKKELNTVNDIIVTSEDNTLSVIEVNSNLKNLKILVTIKKTFLWER